MCQTATAVAEQTTTDLAQLKPAVDEACRFQDMSHRYLDRHHTPVFGDDRVNLAFSSSYIQISRHANFLMQSALLVIGFRVLTAILERLAHSARDRKGSQRMWGMNRHVVGSS